MRAIVVLGATIVLLAVSGCSDSQPDPVLVEGVRVTPQSVQLTVIGETRQLTATTSPVDATDQAITWESTDPTVASVDADGLVTARAAGIGVFITAITHDGHHESSSNVAVVP